ncbi:MAG: iron uptake porin, partial [Cyanobacteriota bacterium]
SEDISGDDDNDGIPDRDRNTNSVSLAVVDYRFPLGNNATVNIFANGGRHSLYADIITQYRSSPIYSIGGNGAGIALNYNISDAFQVDLGYIATKPNNPNAGTGLFNGNYSAFGQLAFQPNEQFQIGLTYVHAFNRTGNLSIAAAGGYLGNLVTASDGIASDSYGIEASYRVSEKFIIGGWVGFTNARLLNLGEAEIWNYALTLGFPDLGKEGNLGVLTVGVEPTLKGLEINNASIGIPSRDENLYAEASYKYVVTDNISITTGLRWQPALFQTSENDDFFIGSLRTTFSF